MEGGGNRVDVGRAHNLPLYFVSVTRSLTGSLNPIHAMHACRYSFNAMSMLSIDTVMAAITVARITNTTTLAAASSGLVTAMLVYYRTRTWCMLSICNGILGGECEPGALSPSWHGA